MDSPMKTWPWLRMKWNHLPNSPDEEHPITLSFSLHVLIGQVVPATLKISGSINGHEVVILIDGGSTNNFIQTRLAMHLGLPVQPSAHLRMPVKNGDSVFCKGACVRVPLKLDRISFPVNLLLLPIYGIDVVLGVQWMVELGSILFDYNQLWMKFDWGGDRVRLNRVKQPNYIYISTSTLQKKGGTLDPAQYFHLSIEANVMHLTPKFGLDPPTDFISQLQDLLSQFDDVFPNPFSLPPQRELDH